MSLKRIIEKGTATPVWKIHTTIDSPAKNVELRFIDRPVSEPESAKKVRIDHFVKQLEKRKRVLEEEAQREGNGKVYEIRKQEIDLKPGAVPFSLFETTGDGTLNFDGITTNYWDYSIQGDKTIIRVYKINYSEWIACQTPDFSRSYFESGLKLPNAGIGASVVLETVDNLFVLTQRGLETINYPGQVFTVGGGVRKKGTIRDQIIAQIVQETGLTPGRFEDADYNPNNLVITALGEEKNYAGGLHPRLEIVSHLPLNVYWTDVVTAAKKTAFESDVNGSFPIPTDPHNLASRLVSMAVSGELLPAAEMGIYAAFANKHNNQFGFGHAKLQANKLLEALNKYKRKKYEAPELR